MEKIIDVAEQIEADNQFEDVTSKVETDIVDVDEFDEIVKKIDAMTLDATKKIENGRYNIIQNIKITSAKYNTINGIDHIYMMAIDRGFKDVTVEDCIKIASVVMCNLDQTPTGDIEKLKEYFDSKFYNKDLLLSNGKLDNVTYVQELANIEIMQTLGSVCDDIVEFKRKSDSEIQELIDELEKLDAKRYDHWLHTDMLELRDKEKDLVREYNTKIMELTESYDN